jgi:hypothetical protein
MKTLPPARKLASCPLIAIMLGSASILIRPSSRCASSWKKSSGFGRVIVAIPSSWLRKLDWDSSLKVVLFDVPTAEMVTPSLSSRVFETSATLTSSITCCGARTCSRLITRGPATATVCTAPVPRASLIWIFVPPFPSPTVTGSTSPRLRRRIHA